MSSAVVAYGGPDVLGDVEDAAAELVDGHGSKGIVAFEGGIELRHVAGVVLVVVNGHGRRVDVRFERVGGVGEIGEGVGHGIRFLAGDTDAVEATV